MAHLKKILPFVACAVFLLTACQQGGYESATGRTGPSESGLSASSVSWKTYNSRYQFSFSYPSDIQIEEEYDGRKISGYNYYYKNNFNANPEGFSREQYKIEVTMSTKPGQGCTEASLSNHPEDPDLVIEKMTVSGFPGYKWAPQYGGHLMCFTMPEGTVSAAIFGDADQERFINSFSVATDASL